MIIGNGLAARLRRLGLPTIVVDKNQNSGDAWRNRYNSPHLHDPVWYDHLPYLKFPDDWQLSVWTYGQRQKRTCRYYSLSFAESCVVSTGACSR